MLRAQTLLPEPRWRLNFQETHRTGILEEGLEWGLGLLLLFVWVFFFFETGSCYVTQAGLEFTRQIRQASNSQSSCLCLLSAVITPG
jgi:hypothetical protein